MPRFRKKPVVVHAVQFDPDAKEWPEEVYVQDGKFLMSTLEGVFTVTPEDWIITGVKGEKYPCKPDIFEATYDEMSSEGDGEQWDGSCRVTLATPP